MHEPLAFLNGKLIPGRDAAVSVGDAGFVLGTTVAEQLRTFGGNLFRLDEHLSRLLRSLEIVGVDPGMTRAQLADTARDLTARNHALLATGDDLGLSIFVTPGAYPVYPPPGAGGPAVCMHTYNLPFSRWAEKYRTGQAVATTAIQQVPPHCWPPELKCRSRMHYYLADRQAMAVDLAARALLLDARGLVAEASTASLLIYNAAEGLISPPLSMILHGISMAVVAQLCETLGVHWGERELRIDDVAEADEVLLCSTTTCVIPVTRLNGRPIGDGRPGPLFQRLLGAWGELVGVDIVAQAEKFARRP